MRGDDTAGNQRGGGDRLGGQSAAHFGHDGQHLDRARVVVESQSEDADFGELLPQLAAQEIADAQIVVATGSAGTHAGILVGLAAHERANQVIGIAVSGDTSQKEALVRDLAIATAANLGVAAADLPPRVRVLDAYVGPGYGLPTPEMVEAVQLVARLEGLLIDPVYTGKAMAGLIDLVRRGQIDGDRPVVFWHTGGIPALFAYPTTVVPAGN